MAITYNYNSTTKLLTSIAMTGDSNNSTYSYAYDSYHRLLTENESTPFILKLIQKIQKYRFRAFT